MSAPEVRTVIEDWTTVCALEDLLPDRGAAALVESGGQTRQVALFRLRDDEIIHAVDHRDPFTGANVIARGLVGTRGDVPTVASPLHKQVFDLRTGQALDYPDVALDTWDTRVQDGMVQLRPRQEAG